MAARVLVPSVGYSAAFLLTAAAMLPALALARHERPAPVTMRALPDMG